MSLEQGPYHNAAMMKYLLVTWESHQPMIPWVTAMVNLIAPKLKLNK